MGYMANFMVYTLAMIGVIAVALIVFKNSNSFNSSGKAKSLRVLDSLSIAPRKTLYIVSTGRENFLIAGDVGNTTLISKLENVYAKSEEDKILNIPEPKTSFMDTMNSLSRPVDKSNIGIRSSMLSEASKQQSVMRSLVEKMK